jgi:hypothetical protein
MVEATVAGKLLFSGSALTILFSSSGLQNKCSPKPNFKNFLHNKRNKPFSDHVTTVIWVWKDKVTMTVHITMFVCC